MEPVDLDGNWLADNEPILPEVLEYFFFSFFFPFFCVMAQYIYTVPLLCHTLCRSTGSDHGDYVIMALPFLMFQSASLNAIIALSSLSRLLFIFNSDALRILYD